MQSTWENLVELDMSESGVRPVTLRELAEMGLDLDSILDMPLGYSQSNGTIRIARGVDARLSRRVGRSDRSHQRHVGSELPAGAGAAARRRRGGARSSELHAVRRRAAQPGREGEPLPPAHRRRLGAGLGRVRARRESPKTRLVYLSNPNNPSGSILTPAAMERIVRRCEEVGAYLLADEVYLGAEIHCERTPSFWGMSDRVIVTSGLSKAYGIPGVRIGWIVGPDGCGGGVLEPARLHHHRAQQDLRRRGARRRAAGESREALRAHARHPAAESAHHAPVGGELRRLPHLPRAAGRRALPDALRFAHAQLRTGGAHPGEAERADRARRRTWGSKALSRVWLGGKPEFLAEGLRRIGLELRAESIGSASAHG